MQYKACSQSDEQRDEHRLHYCGTCKTMGALYGQTSRFLLNNDAVFLAELLSALQTESSSLPSWAVEYQSYNCMTLPPKSDQLPLPLQLAADVTMLLTELKIEDQLDDSSSVAWPIARNFLAKSTAQASEALEVRGFPIAEIWQLSSEQATREHFVRVHAANFTLVQLIDYCAKPTAEITGLVFANAARVCGTTVKAQSAMMDIGSSFGNLVYALDAIEDFDRDVRRKQFNPFIIASIADFRRSRGMVASDAVSTKDYDLLLSYIRAQVHRIEDSLRGNLKAEASASFTKRLRENVTGKLGPHWSACASCSHNHRASRELDAADTPHLALPRACTNLPIGWSERRSLSLELANKFVSPSDRKPQELVSFVAVVVTTFLFPYYSKQSKSLAQCLSVPWNLIAWISLLNDIARFLPGGNNGLGATVALMGATGGSTGGPGGYYGSGNSGGGNSGGTAGSGGQDEHGADEPHPEGERPKRSRKPFGDPEPQEPLPEIVPGEDRTHRPPESPTGAPVRRPEQPTYYGTRYSNSPYSVGPGPYAGRNSCGCCCANCCAQIGCNICADCMCNSCCDALCSSADCCASTGGGADCCGGCGAVDCGSCGGGADCCASCGSGADCCGSCSGCGDCCNGCDACNSCGSCSC